MEDFKNDISNCIAILKNGGIILYPTDTIWGLGCDATNETALQKIFDIKKRSESKSLISLVNNDAMLNKYVHEVPALAWDIIDLSEKPTTIVYENVKFLAKNAIADDGSAGIRLTKDPFCQALIFKFGKPIISTSANVSGEAAGASFSEIAEEIISKVDYVVKYRQKEKIQAAASAVVKLGLSGEITILRK